MGRRLNQNSDTWGGSWGSASAWGGSWGWSWGPLHEVYAPPLEPGGHWKHLFTPAYGASPPAVKGEATSRWKVLRPDTHFAHIGAATPSVIGFTTSRYQILLPDTGTKTLQVTEECGASFRILRPRCGATARFVPGGKVYATYGMTTPHCGAGTSVVRGYGWCVGTTERPVVVRNPSPVELIALVL